MTTYFPIMKSRRGEYRALASLDRVTRSRCVPIVELQPPQAPRQMPGKPPGPPKTIDQQVTDHLTSITQASSDNHRVVLDFAGLPEEKTSEGSHPANLLMRQLHLRGVQAQPVIWLKSSLLLMKALKGEPSAKHGVTLRLTATDVDFGEEAIQVVLSYVGVEPSVVDLIVDFRAIEDAGALRIGMMTAAVTSLAEQRWRSVSVAGTSFPEALTQYGEGQFRFPRHEWAAWLAVQGMGGCIDYSDYGVRNVPPPTGRGWDHTDPQPPVHPRG